MKCCPNTNKRSLLLALLTLLLAFIFAQGIKKVPLEGDWQEQLAIPSIAEFSSGGGSVMGGNGDLVTVRNIRNFRYYPTEQETHPDYYDKTYDLTQIKQVWYVTEPFNENKLAAHTLVSFEFNNGDFLAITIEARKTKSQGYNIWKGLLRTYPLIYIAADERDVILMRANLRKDQVYVYPVKLQSKENARLFLISMLTRMNELVSSKPAWYHTLFANCTSEIAKHVNKVTPGRIPMLSWQLWLTASADELALKHGLLDTNLTIKEAREKYSINTTSERIGDLPSYSSEIRKFGE